MKTKQFIEVLKPVQGKEFIDGYCFCSFCRTLIAVQNIVMLEELADKAQTKIYVEAAGAIKEIITATRLDDILRQLKKASPNQSTRAGKEKIY